MAHSVSARKRIRQNIRRRARNRRCKGQVKQLVRRFDEALLAGDAQRAAKELQAVYKKLDKVADTGTIHKNTAARKKSRLARRLNKAKVGV